MWCSISKFLIDIGENESKVPAKRPRKSNDSAEPKVTIDFATPYFRGKYSNANDILNSPNLSVVDRRIESKHESLL